ncbi:hypothetical protein WDW37_04250 [Bdellovibrionota bacterium FG-1]
MKVLLLNPHVDAKNSLVQILQAHGYAVILPANAEEAGLMLSLHGNSIDLAVVHREDSINKDNENGLKFVTQLKADPLQSDLPFIITSQVWGDAEFVRHQATAQGANAYLKWPFDANMLNQTIRAVFGTEAPPQVEFSSPSIPTAVGHTHELVLEEVSSVLGGQAVQPETDTSIRLEAPEFDLPTAESLAPESSAPEPLSLDAPSLVLEPSQVELPSLPMLEFGDIELPSEPEPPQPPLGDLGQQGNDADAAEQMPYLYESSQGHPHAAAVFAQPLGDAVVPGGAAHSPDIETLKKYLLLREQDVGVLSNQLQATQDQMRSIEQAFREERAKNIELTHISQGQKQKLEQFESEKNHALDGLQGELAELRFQLKAKTDKARIMDSQVREATDEMEHLKERVRSDIRKIRVREKDLENRLEIAKKDAEALLSARENKIIELKRKLDLLEFNMDLLQDQHAREKENSQKLRERLSKAAQVVRVAGGLLDNPAEAAQLAAALAEDEASGKDAA